MPGSIDRPVFNDASGVRALVFQWSGRGVVVLGLLVVIAVGWALRTHVSLPGLDGLRVSDRIHRIFKTEHPTTPIATVPTVRTAIGDSTGRPSRSTLEFDTRRSSRGPSDPTSKPATAKPAPRLERALVKVLVPTIAPTTSSTPPHRPVVKAPHRTKSQRTVKVQRTAKVRNPNAAHPSQPTAKKNNGSKLKAGGSKAEHPKVKSGSKQSTKSHPAKKPKSR